MTLDTDCSLCHVFFITGPHNRPILFCSMSSVVIICRRRLSSSVMLPAGRVCCQSGSRYCTAGQYGYIPLGRHLVHLTLCKIRDEKMLIMPLSVFTLLAGCATYDYLMFQSAYLHSSLSKSGINEIYLAYYSLSLTLRNGFLSIFTRNVLEESLYKWTF